MMTLYDLAIGRSLVYVVTRLFDYAEKIKAERVEQAVLKGLCKAMRENGIEQTSHEPITFVPFRDTGQNKIKAANKTKIIYEEDVKRLNRLFAVVGFLDGLSKDEGVCMEIGYAYGVGVPILIILTDFIRREFKEVPESGHLLDPVLLAMATRIVYEYKIPPMEASFLDRLTAGLEYVYERIVGEVYLLATTTSPPIDSASVQNSSLFDVYIDFGGGHFEWERILQKELSQVLNLMSISAQTSQRYAWCVECPSIPSSSIRVSDFGLRDITNAANAKVVVTCGDGDEMSSGTAAIHGFARALNKKVLLYDSRVTYLVGDEGHRMSRNLMIDYSADKVVRDFDDLPDAIEMLLGT